METGCWIIFAASEVRNFTRQLEVAHASREAEVNGKQSLWDSWGREGCMLLIQELIPKSNPMVSLVNFVRVLCVMLLFIVLCLFCQYFILKEKGLKQDLCFVSSGCSVTEKR